MAKSPNMTAAGEYYSPEGDLHHLTRAHEVKSNPKRHKAALALAKQKQAAMQAITTPAAAIPAAPTTKEMK